MIFHVATTRKMAYSPNQLKIRWIGWSDGRFSRIFGRDSLTPGVAFLTYCLGDDITEHVEE